jgi:hypothetical protein
MVGDSLNHSPLTPVQPDGRSAADRRSEVNSSNHQSDTSEKSAGYGGPSRSGWRRILSGDSQYPSHLSAIVALPTQA